MVATIAATPDNPVIVITPSVVQTATTHISWDTGSAAILARLRMSENGGAFARFGAADSAQPTRAGKDAPLTVHLHSKYAFELRRDGSEALLASYLVTTREQNILLEPLANVIHARAPTRQAIYQVQVDPRPESVRVQFRTRQATAPFLDVKTEDGILAGAQLGPVGTAHDFALPLGLDPTPQNRVFNVHIFAPSTEGAVRTAEANVLFRTGSRRAWVFFDHLFVRKDGDPGPFQGDGDFYFQFEAGEVGASGKFGAADFKDAVGDRENRSLDRVVSTDVAPGEIWARMSATEGDEEIWSQFFGADVFEDPPEGVEHHRAGSDEVITVTKHFDLAAFAGPVDEIAFNLDTGPLVFDLGVTCRLRVETDPGGVIAPMILKRPAATRAPDPVAYLGLLDRTRVGRETTLQRAWNGELYLAERTDQRRPPRWAKVAPASLGIVTVVRSKDGPQIFSLTDGGQAQVLDLDCGLWRQIGGRFVGRLLAVDGEDGPILFGLDGEGAVHQRQGDGDWIRIAGGVVADLNVFVRPGIVGLAARGTAGEVIYLEPTAGAEWTRLGRGPEGRLIAGATQGGLAFAVVRDDETISLALASDPPDRLDWREGGDITGLLDRRYSLADFPQNSREGGTSTAL